MKACKDLSGNRSTCFFCDGSSRRALRSEQRTRMYNDAVWALNWLFGTAAWGPDKKGNEVAARLRRLVFTVPTSAEAPVPEAALWELLRGRGVYEVGLGCGSRAIPFEAGVTASELGWISGTR